MLNRQNKTFNFIIGGFLALIFSTVTVAEDNFIAAYKSFDLTKIKADIKRLSSDEFGGRAPSSAGEKLTLAMLEQRFKALGLKPGNGDSYLQAVPMNSILSEPTQPLTIADIAFEYPKNYVASSRKTQTNIELKNSQLVFVGYGINAPEYQWNDYKNIDVKGKTVVVLVNDPGFATQNPKLFDGNAMTYYGRWTYKYEEAARQGAAGAIIIHETKPASYGWNVIESSWGGEQFHLPAKEVNEASLDVEMWISRAKAQQLLAKAGLDLDNLKQQALKRNFQAKALNLTANITLKNTIKDSVSYNVIATLTGKKRPDEHIMYMAHWDHLGSTEIDGKKVIFNGAHDNASGTAGLLHLAKAFTTLKQRPERSVTFIAVTAEEQGRLGSRYFANHPTMPLKNIVSLINMDSLDVSGLKTDMSVVGFGKSELEKYLTKAVKRQNRILVPEPTPERGYYYRSDHFSLAKKGVPALRAKGGTKWLNAEQKAIGDRIKATVEKCYHQACDEYDENWGWQSMIAELQVFFETGYLLSNTDDWPNWQQGTEFRQARDAMMKQK